MFQYSLNFMQSPMIRRVIPILCFTALCWAVFLVNHTLLSDHLNQYGIRPRHASGLPGIVWSPFLHGSFQHLAANTVPLLILGLVLSIRSRIEFISITVAGIFLSGGLVWLLGRGAYHIGASSLIFCYFGYLTSFAFFERKVANMLLSIVCIFAYGGILRGIVPTSAAVSWEGHLLGLFSGIALAWFSANLKKAEGDSKLPSVEARPPLNKEDRISKN
jgi:membrane associated rhomboid family serine protease